MFTCRQPVMFQHCDPAGIMFYPRYFEMLNAVTETWFAERLGVSFADLVGPRGAGVPTARIEAEFLRPSRLGEVLRFGVRATRLGRSSADLAFEAHGPEGLRLRARSVLVHVDAAGRAAPWPDDLRAALARDCKEAEDG